MIHDQALDTLSVLIDEMKVALHKAESSYKRLEHTRNQMFIYNKSLTKLRQESVNRVFTTNHTIVYTLNRKLVTTCIYLAILFGIYTTMFTNPPAIWTFWGLIAISELILKQMI
jgi:hypothetical protein